MKEKILSDLVIKRVCLATTMYNRENTGKKRKKRPCWALIIKYEGETLYFSDGKTYRSNANNVILLPKGCSYEWSCIKSGHYSVVEFDSELEHDGIMSFSVRNSDKILSVMKRLEYIRTLGGELSELESKRDVYSLLLTLAKTEPKAYMPTQKHEKIAPALDYIAENYSAVITNDELAELTGLSTVYFRKLFVKVMGIPPIDYVQSLRMEKAKEMLRSDYSSVTDIALAIGYRNVYDFSRAFKKRVGVSPTAFKSREK